MRNRQLVFAAIALLLSFGTNAQDAESILAKARAMQLARWDGVQDYTVVQSVAGIRAIMYYERVDEASFRVVPQSELQRQAAAASGLHSMTPEEVAAIADTEGDGAIADFDDIQELAKSADVLGTESIGDRKGFHLKADDVDRVQAMGDQNITFDTFEIWIDTTDYVPLKILIHGTGSGPEGSRPVMVNIVFSDYRNVPDSKLFEAYRQTMSMGGVLDPQQQKELQEAMKQMDEMEAQLAAMPEAQRKMMEGMMGPQIEMMKKMASGGAMEVVTETIEIKVNTGVLNPEETSQALTGGTGMTAATPAVAPDELLHTIQNDLETLGYTPGNTKGIMDKPTAVAIAQFQAAQGMKVTGKSSPQLAGALQAAKNGISKDQLTAAYLKGFWCTERMQEREVYNFAADGTYRLGVVGMTITQMDGFNYLPETYSRQSFLDKFDGIATKDQDRFSVTKKRGSMETFLRGNCIN